MIRVPSEDEEQARHVSRQREQLVHHRQKMEAQGRGLLVSHASAGAGALVEEPDLESAGKLLPRGSLCDWKFTGRLSLLCRSRSRL